jgi:hypothetical protein
LAKEINFDKDYQSVIITRATICSNIARGQAVARIWTVETVALDVESVEGEIDLLINVCSVDQPAFAQSIRVQTWIAR